MNYMSLVSVETKRHNTDSCEFHFKKENVKVIVIFTNRNDATFLTSSNRVRGYTSQLIDILLCRPFGFYKTMMMIRVNEVMIIRGDYNFH